MDRRSLLQLFGVGSTVVPLIGSTPRLDAEARIVEPPKVELAQRAPMAQPCSPISFPDESSITVIVDHPNGDRTILRPEKLEIDFRSFGTTQPGEDPMGWLVQGSMRRLHIDLSMSGSGLATRYRKDPTR